MRLSSIAAERWSEISSHYYMVNLLRLKPHEYANRVYAWCVERVASDDLDQWIVDLDDLLPWQDSNSAAAENLESASFMSMMAKG